MIDQIVNGDQSSGHLSELYVQVDKVVDIVDQIFKNSSALSLFEGTQMLEVPQA